MTCSLFEHKGLSRCPRACQFFETVRTLYIIIHQLCMHSRQQTSEKYNRNDYSAVASAVRVHLSTAEDNQGPETSHHRSFALKVDCYLFASSAVVAGTSMHRCQKVLYANLCDFSGMSAVFDVLG